jgi:hypothetical protein
MKRYVFIESALKMGATFLGGLGFVWLSSVCTEKFQNSMPWLLCDGTERRWRVIEGETGEWSV